MSNVRRTVKSRVPVVRQPVKKERQGLQRPSLYRVVLLNDDYTPMDFVVNVLESLFGMPREQAVRTMLMVHTQGQASVGTFTKDVAETKAAQVNRFAASCEHPLLAASLKI